MERFGTGMGRGRIGLTWAAVLVAIGSIPITVRGQAGIDSSERRLAQYQRETRINVDQNVPVSQRTGFDYGGFLQPSYFSVDDSVGNNHVLRQYDLVGYGRVNLDRIHEFFILGRGSYLDYAPGDSFDGKGDQHEGSLDRAYYRIDFAQMQSTKSGEPADRVASAQLGRQLFYWGNGLVISEVLDGAKVNLGSDTLEFEAIAGITPHHTVDIDTSRPGFEDHTSRGFAGLMASKQFGVHRPYVYAMVQRDYNDQELTTGAVTTRYDYNTNYFGAGSRGAIGDRLSYGVEAAFETGRGLSNSFDVGPTGPVQVPQTREDISAYAADVQIDYLLSDLRRTRLSGEFILASGDPDRQQTTNTFGGNASGTDDHAFNAFGLLNTGLAFAPSVSNLLVLRAGISTFPLAATAWSQRLQVGTDLFVFAKYRKDAPVDESTSDSRYLGFEPDFFLNWQLTEDFSLSVRYGIFFTGEAIESDDSARQAIFVGATYAF